MDKDDFLSLYRKLGEVHDSKVRGLQGRIEELESQLKERESSLIDQLDDLKDPAILIDKNNRVRFVNEAFHDATDYEVEEVAGKKVHNFIKGLYFLDQIRRHPLFSDLEDWISIKSVPTGIYTKERKLILKGAKIRIKSTSDLEYGGATLILGRMKWVLPKTTKTLRTLLSENKYNLFFVNDFLVDGVLNLETVGEDENKKEGLVNKLAQCVSKDNRRRIIVMFNELNECDPRLYEALASFSRMSTFRKVARLGMSKKNNVYCYVNKDSEVHKGLIEAEFPKNHIKFLKQ